MTKQPVNSKDISSDEDSGELSSELWSDKDSESSDGVDSSSNHDHDDQSDDDDHNDQSGSEESNEDTEGSDKSEQEDDVYVSDLEGSGSDDEDNDNGQENLSDNEESDHRVDESDSSEDEVSPRNTIGTVPFEWYKDEEHIGYDKSGKKLKKRERQDKLDLLLQSADNKNSWRKIYDEYNDEDVELTKDETKMIRKLMKGKAPHVEFDPYAPYVDWFKWDGANHPLSNAPEPKRRFIPSKWEAKKVVKYIRAIRKGLITFDKPKEEPRFYNLWGDDSVSKEKSGGLAYIPAPKPKLPGHEESYNPSQEYIPTQEEINNYQLMFEEDRPKFIPKRFTSLRSVPAYDKFITEFFHRCLDLYLCPRVIKKRINVDPESLKPKLPNRKDLRPYPNTCYLEYKGHNGPVMSISVDSSGQWIASGSSDGSVRIWEIETGRCLRIYEIGEAVKYVAWNPLPDRPILAVVSGEYVYLLNAGFGEEEKNVVKTLFEEPVKADESAQQEKNNSDAHVKWVQDEEHEGIKIEHAKSVATVEWHRKGDYFSAVVPAGESRSVLIHKLSKKLTQRVPLKLHGIAVSTCFHPTQSFFFISTKKNVHVFDLVKQTPIKKLESGFREVSSVSVHPGGDNAIVGSREGKMSWFDMDLSSKPYRIFKCHSKDINNVEYHRTYPLFASCSDDCTAYVFHGMVYSDLNQNPLIVPLEILRGHSSSNGRGVLDCKFHPRQPWLFTAGADSVIKLFCN
jgi:ribosome biogenesis protein ERB1